MISLIDLIGHASNALFTLAAGFRNMFYLRIAMIVATLLELIYNYFITPTPLWTPIYWCIALIMMNFYQMTAIMLKKKFINLTDEELRIYNHIGKDMDILNFKTLIRLGSIESNQLPINIIQENTPLEYLYLLTKGTATVHLNGNEITRISPDNFIGEMSFLAQNLPGTSVVLEPNSTVIRWNKSTLNAILDKKDEIRSELHYILSDQLIHKLTLQNKLAISQMVV